MSLFGSNTRGSRSGPLEVTLEPEFENDGQDFYDFNVVEIKGNTEPPTPTSLSDVDWCSEDISNVGAKDLFFDGKPPEVKEGQRIVLKGHMWSECYSGMDGDDWETGFDVGSIEIVEVQK